ncbi:sucC, partial [Symbiodinium sp. KB8]
MEKFGVKVQKGKMAESSQGAFDVAKWVKAQIHAGGRGKGHFDNGFKGGVQICDT